MSNASFPAVTIGVASYNNARFILETLDSVCNQDYPNIQIIVVDDCSTDNSVELIESWIKRVSQPGKVLFIRHSKNTGICRSSNEILQNAEGKYYMILGSDDVLLPEKISSQVAQLETLGDEYALSYSNVYMIDAEGNEIREAFHDKHFKKKSGNLFVDILRQNFIQAPSTLYRTSAVKAVGGYDESLTFEDLDMLLRLSKEYKIAYNEFLNSKYRRIPSSVSGKFSIKHLLSTLKILNKHCGYSKEADDLINAYIVNNAEVVYREGGSNVAYWMKRKWEIDKNFKTLGVYILSVMKVPYKYVLIVSKYI